VIRKVVLLTWEKYYNYEKNEGVWVISTTVRDLLHWLITAISELTTRFAETKEATKDVRTTVENISQQVDIIAGKVDKPRTPEQVNPV
jgi:hypothetical protein